MLGFGSAQQGAGFAFNGKTALVEHKRVGPARLAGQFIFEDNTHILGRLGYLPQAVLQDTNRVAPTPALVATGVQHKARHGLNNISTAWQDRTSAHLTPSRNSR